MAAAIIAIRKARAKAKAGARLAFHEGVDLADAEDGTPAAPARLLRTFSAATTGAGSREGLGWRRYQRQALKLYNNIYVQSTVAGLIVLNFLVNILQAQIDPKGKDPGGVFYAFDVFFNVAFLFELWLNMYSVWFKKFWKSSWNVFDFSVVAIGWLFQLNVPLPGPMKLLRLMRAFRVFRLFKRVESLRKIMSSLASAVPGVMNAFILQAIITCIFAIIGVDRFHDYGDEGFMINEGDQSVALSSPRELNYGHNYFGNFGKALYTMFQCVTEESWVEAIARPMLNSNSPTTSTGSAFFFVLNNLINTVILMNVVVAVLLEKMIPNGDDDKKKDEDDAESTEDDENPEKDEKETEAVPLIEQRFNLVVESVTDLQKQVDNFTAVSKAMHKQISSVDEIRDMVNALLDHHGIAARPLAELGGGKAHTNGHMPRQETDDPMHDMPIPNQPTGHAG